MAVLGLVLLVAVLVGWQQLTEPIPEADSGPSAEPTGPCTDAQVKAGTRIRPDMVTVSVYNAGTRTGQADKTLELLARRGFGRGETGNAPEGASVRKSQVWVSKVPDPAARLVASWLGPRVKIAQRKTIGVGVMVVVGDDFRGTLVRGDRSVVTKRAATVCTPNPPDPDA